MRIPIHTSRTASWSRRFGSFALPLLIIPVVLHRADIMDSETFDLIEVIAFGLAALAVIFGLWAFGRLWFTGDRGWGKAVSGVTLGIVCLLPLAYGAVQATRYPWIHDVSTDAEDPPQLAGIDRNIEYETDQATVTGAFPAIVPRTYPISARVAYDIAKQLIHQHKWMVVSDTAPDLGSQAEIHAVVRTMMGWKDEVTVRISGTAGGVRVDMRSASQAGSFDLGRNGVRVTEFLDAFDDAAANRAERTRAPDAPPLPATRRSQ